MDNFSLYDLSVQKNEERPNAITYINYIFDDFIELSGDRLVGNDPSIVGGIALIDELPVTVIGQLRGNSLSEQIKYNFSMTLPEGFRKALRLMKQAEKFKRPIICFVDTIGAFPGRESEEGGIVSAISSNLIEMMFLKTPIITVLIGNGSSGGALALCVADRIAILENAVLSIISPKACAEILWKDTSLEIDAAELLNMTSKNLFRQGIVDHIILESNNIAHIDTIKTAEKIKLYILQELQLLNKKRPSLLVKQRQKKFDEICNCKVNTYGK